MIESKYLDIQKHNILQSIILHLFPGLCIGLVYFLLVNPVRNAGYPTAMALIISGGLVLIPLELIILWIVKRKNKVSTYQNIIANREPISKKQYVFWIIAVILISGIVFGIGDSLAVFFRDSIFSWIPETHHLDMGYSEEYSVSTLTLTYTLGFVLLAIIAPIVEEVYFRGYLLPRVPKMKGFDGVFHSFLFALYHFWTPWMILTRTIGFYPFVYAVQKNRNIYISIIGHVLVNTIDFIVGFIFVYSLI